MDDGTFGYVLSSFGFNVETDVGINGCHVCKFYYKQDDKHMCSSTNYQEHMGTAELVDNEGNQIKDPSKWCSNWFLPKQEEK
jgi:hypothetical protein